MNQITILGGNNNGVDYEGIAKKFIKIENDLGEDPTTTLDQLLNIAKRDATWKSVSKSADPEVIQGHFEKLLDWVRKLTSKDD